MRTRATTVRVRCRCGADVAVSLPPGVTLAILMGGAADGEATAECPCGETTRVPTVSRS